MSRPAFGRYYDVDPFLSTGAPNGRPVVAKYALGGADTYATLCDLGIIQRVGQYKHLNVAFDPLWSNPVPVIGIRGSGCSATLLPRPKGAAAPGVTVFPTRDTAERGPFRTVGVPASAIKSWRDVGPKAAICIIGSIQPSDFTTTLASEDVEIQRQRILSALDGYETARRSSRVNLPGDMTLSAPSTDESDPFAPSTARPPAPSRGSFVAGDNADPAGHQSPRHAGFSCPPRDAQGSLGDAARTNGGSNGDVALKADDTSIDRREMLAIITQYLMRAVPAASRRVGDCVILQTGSPWIAETLGRGVSMFLATLPVEKQDSIKLLTVQSRPYIAMSATISAARDRAAAAATGSSGPGGAFGNAAPPPSTLTGEGAAHGRFTPPPPAPPPLLAPLASQSSRAPFFTTHHLCLLARSGAGPASASATTAGNALGTKRVGPASREDVVRFVKEALTELATPRISPHDRAPPPPVQDEVVTAEQVSGVKGFFRGMKRFVSGAIQKGKQVTLRGGGASDSSESHAAKSRSDDHVSGTQLHGNAAGPAAVMCAVLFGGVMEEVAPELLHFVKKRWRILVVADSSGYAERLAATMERITQVCPNPTLDDFRALLGSCDAITSEILANGLITVVPKGTCSEDLGELIAMTLSGDETLRHAWAKFALWRANARSYERTTVGFQVVLLLFGILATALSIVQTYLQLTFPSETNRKTDTTRTELNNIYQALNLVLIALPIVSSLASTLLMQVEPALKYVTLRRCAELLLREIFMYRTGTRGYSETQIVACRTKKAAEEAAAAAASKIGDDLPQSSKKPSDEAGAGDAAAAGGANSSEGIDRSDDATAGGGGGGSADGEEAQQREKQQSEPNDDNRNNANGNSKNNSNNNNTTTTTNNAEFNGDNDGAAAAAALRAEEVAAGVNEEILTGCWADTEPYESREELLHRRLEALTNDVIEYVGDTTLEDYTGPLPPPDCRINGDDGFSDLTPDQYVELRLRPAVRKYAETSTELERGVSFLTISIYVFGAAGTMLAAVAMLSSLEQYNLQAWVALTTAMQSAFTRYLDSSRLDWIFRAHKRTCDMLTNVESWWAQLQQPGLKTDSQSNRDLLVGKAETLITTEVEDTGQQLRSLNARLKKAQDQQQQENDEIQAKLLAGEDADKMKELKKAGIANFNADSIAAAIADPHGAAGAEMRKTLARMEEQLERQPLTDELLLVKRAEYAAEYKRRLAFLDTAVVDTNAQLIKDGNLGGLLFATLVPPDIRNRFLDKQFIARLMITVTSLDPQQVNRQSMLALLASAKRDLGEDSAALPHRQLLSLMKEFAQQKMSEDFEEALRAMDVDMYDLVSTRKRFEILLSELRTISQLNWREMKGDNILALVQDPEIHEALGALGEAKLRGVLKRAERFFVEAGPVTAMLNCCVQDIAHIDVSEVVLSSATSAIDRAQLRSRVVANEQHFRVELLRRHELLDLLPAKLRTEDTVITASPLQLAAYVREIGGGSLILQIADCVVHRETERAAAGASAAAVSVMSPMSRLIESTEKRARLMHSFLEIDAASLIELGKDGLIRRLSVCPLMTRLMCDELRLIPEPDIKRVAGSFTAAVSTSFPSLIFSSVAQELSHMELDQLVPRVELRGEVLRRAQQLRGVASFSALSRREVLSCVAVPPLVQVFQSTPKEPLIELFTALVGATRDRFAVATVVALLPALSPTDAVIVRGWNDYDCSRLLHATQLTRNVTEALEADAAGGAASNAASVAAAAASAGSHRRASNSAGQSRRRSSASASVATSTVLQRMADNEALSLLGSLSGEGRTAVVATFFERLAPASSHTFLAAVSQLLLRTGGGGGGGSGSGGVCSVLGECFAQPENHSVLVDVACTLLANEVEADGTMENAGSPVGAVDAQMLMRALSDPRLAHTGLAPRWRSVARQVDGDTAAVIASAAALELVWEGPLHVFNAVANRCVYFDVRALFPRITDRLDLVDVWACHVFAAAETADGEASANSAATNEQETGTDRSKQSKHNSALSKAELIRKVDSMPDMENVSACLRSLSDGQHAELMAAFAAELRRSTVTRAVAEVLVRERALGDSTVMRRLRVTVCSVRPVMRSKSKQVVADWFLFEPGAYVAASAKEREKRFSKYITDADTVRFLASMDGERCRFLFAQLPSLSSDASSSLSAIRVGDLLT